MDRLARISTLISDLYGTALDPPAWPQVMQRTLALIGGTAALLRSRDRTADTVSWQCAVGVEPSAWGEALALESDAAPLRQREESEPVGTLFRVPTAHAVTRWGACGSPVEVVGVLLERSVVRVTGLYIRRHAGPGIAERRCQRLLTLLGPHVCQALRIGRRAQDQAPDLALRVQQAARRYGLTPAEARVVQALIGGCTIERGAQLLGIRPATVKTHLQHVFDKTAARRQVDLIKLIAEPRTDESAASRSAPHLAA